MFINFKRLRSWVSDQSSEKQVCVITCNCLMSCIEFTLKNSLILQDKQHDNDLNYEHTIQNDK